MSLKNCKTKAGFILAAVLLILASDSIEACGPNFPNNLLSGGDEVLFTAPVANFRRELERLQLTPSRFDYIGATNGYAEQTFDAELADLTTALQKAKLTGVEAAPIISAHRKNREKLQKFAHEQTVWESNSWMDENTDSKEKRGPKPKFPSFPPVEGLPGEFADYFEGVVALKTPQPDRAAALKAWQRLLERPAAERKYKSTWAAFMLGKLWEVEDADQAVKYFQQTRKLANKGFADSAGLAVAAIGWEARVELRRKHFQRSIELYLEQHAAGDESSIESLRIAAAIAVEAAGDELADLAAKPNLRAVITAYLISDRGVVDYPTGEAPAVRPVEAWLTAVEAAGIKDVGSAERLALAAYQDGEFELADRWIKRAAHSPTAQWLQAKLLLRAGKVSEAVKVLAQVTRALPIVPRQELTNSLEFADAIAVPEESYQMRISREQMVGELGVLALSRGDFSQALDALLRADFWEDAAYVAERVLTTDELKSDVDQNWPATAAETKTNTPSTGLEATAEATDEPPPREVNSTQIRHLLARRLVRENRGHEAEAYFPPEWQSRCHELLDALDVGWNESAPSEQRAQALFTAAKIARAEGMELLGTELAPDWFIHDGEYDCGLTLDSRGENTSGNKINRMTAGEFQRAAAHKPDPDERFHYRYHAASLAWEAAKLMPNNSDETARMLCVGGSWLKNRDPETADLFYKALVRRCRKTAIGEQADEMRWFPILDEAGNPKPYFHQPKTEEASDPEAPTDERDANQAIFASPPIIPQAESVYTIQPGDTLSSIAHEASAAGLLITVGELARANPGLDASRLRIGQRIFIPAPAEATTSDVAPQRNNLGIAPDAPVPLPSAP